MDNSKIEEQLMLLKMMTLKTGVIHEAQALQLKLWPKLIKNVESSVAKVDPSKKTVTFELEGSLRPTKKMREMFDAIKGWTRILLWNETKVIFKYKKKVIYNSEEEDVKLD